MTNILTMCISRDSYRISSWGGGGGGRKRWPDMLFQMLLLVIKCVCFSSNVLMKNQSGRAPNNDVVHNY